jgi:O-methyltransferase involved in polyketide biosynthesis
MKNTLLKSEIPTCQLTRVELDLANDEKRKSFLSEAGTRTSKALIITEGVIPYLTPEQVTKLASELHQESSFVYWITEYFDPMVYKYLKDPARTRQMKNAPFQFYPDDWMGFFRNLGWVQKENRYLGEEAIRRGRSVPMPWWATIFRFFMSAKAKEKATKMTGYLLLQKSK